MIRITRFDADGKVFHQKVDAGPVELGTNVFGNIWLSTPLRYWRMLPGGRIEIEAI